MNATVTRWSLFKRLGFMFIAVYLGITIVPDILGVIPGIGDLLLGFWAALMPVLGNAAFGIDEPILVRMTGSSDMLWAWIKTFWLLVLALATAITVVAIDRRRNDYARGYAWLRVLVRYALALALLGYGFAKLTGDQFAPPSAMELTRTYGESSPMGLAWTFMGYSTAYCWFAGLVEILAGALLLSRRTTTLGALVACGALANVVAINLCYDVPVKLYSSLLLLLAVFLAAHDAPRLIDALIRQVPAADLAAPRTRRARISRVVLKSGFLLIVAAMLVLPLVIEDGAGAPVIQGPLVGAWEVESFAVDGATRSLGETDRWRQFIVGDQGYALVRRKGELSGYGFEPGPEADTITIIDYRVKPPRRHALRVEQPASDQLVLRGTFDEGEVEARLWRIDTDNMRLVTRGFRWVNEAPHNY